MIHLTSENHYLVNQRWLFGSGSFSSSNLTRAYNKRSLRAMYRMTYVVSFLLYSAKHQKSVKAKIHKLEPCFLEGSK